MCTCTQTLRGRVEATPERMKKRCIPTMRTITTVALPLEIKYASTTLQHKRNTVLC